MASNPSNPSNPEVSQPYLSHSAATAILDSPSTATQKIQSLIGNGLDSDLYFGYEGTLLTLAIEYANFPVVRLLLQNGANPNHAAGLHRLPPLCFAAESGDVAIARVLVDAGALVASSHAILVAADYIWPDMLSYLLSVGAPLEDRWDRTQRPAKDRLMGTPLHAVVRARSAIDADDEERKAAGKGYVDGEMKGAESEEATGRVAAEALRGGSRHLEAVRVLLAKGADGAARDEEGKTPLMVGEEGGEGFEGVVKVLREREGKRGT